jgi:hypothetical protein
MCCVVPVPVSPSSPPAERRVGGDAIFLVLAAAAMVCMVVAAQRTWSSAVRTEQSRAQAHALHQWMVQAGHRADDPVAQACALAPSGFREVPHWGDCARALVAEGGPLAGVRNAFSGAPLQVIERCQHGAHATFGQIVVGRRVPPASNAAAGHGTAAGLAPGDTLTHPLALRLQVCDSAGYALDVADLAL